MNHARVGKSFVAACLLSASIATASFGAEDWSQSYNGSSNLLDYPIGLVTPAAGGIYVYGSSVDSTHGYDGLLLKYVGDGSFSWGQLLDGLDNDLDMWQDAEAAGSDALILAGLTTGTSSLDMVISRVDSHGTSPWTTTFGDAGSDNWEEALEAEVLSDGRIVVVGLGGTAAIQQEVIVVGMDSSGSVDWSERYNFDPAQIHLVAGAEVDGDDAVIILGANGDLEDETFATYDLFASKYEEDGTLAWNYTRDTGSGDGASGLVIDADDNVYLVGQSGPVVPAIQLIKLAPDGSETWIETFGAPDVSYTAYDIAIDASGNVGIVGVRIDASENADIITLKYDPAGNLLWDRTYAGPSAAGDQAAAIAIDTFDALYVTGSTGEPHETGQSGVITIKYASDGTEEWQELYEAGDSTVVEAAAIAIEPFGRVLVAAGAYADSTEDFNVTLLSYGAAASDLDDKLTLGIPTRVELSQNFPNPAAERTTVRFGVPVQTNVRIEILAADGRLVSVAVDESLPAGYHQVELPVAGLSRGVYFYRMTTGRERRTRKLTVSN